MVHVSPPLHNEISITDMLHMSVFTFYAHPTLSFVSSYPTEALTLVTLISAQILTRSIYLLSSNHLLTSCPSYQKLVFLLLAVFLGITGAVVEPQL